VVEETWPRAPIIDPATRFTSNLDWRREWPRIVSTLKALVVFGYEDGHIGLGCLQEIVDAVLHGVPIFTIAEEAEGLGVVRLAGLDLPPDARPRLAAVLRPGPPLGSSPKGCSR
jgi:hypothetical protein